MKHKKIQNIEPDKFCQQFVTRGKIFREQQYVTLFQILLLCRDKKQDCHDVNDF